MILAGDSSRRRTEIVGRQKEFFHMDLEEIRMIFDHRGLERKTVNQIPKFEEPQSFSYMG